MRMLNVQLKQAENKHGAFAPEKALCAKNGDINCKKNLTELEQSHYDLQIVRKNRGLLITEFDEALISLDSKIVSLIFSL